MKEFEEKDDKLLQEKHEGGEHHKEILVKNCPPYNSDFQLQDAKPETVLIQEKDFKPGPENYSARTEPSIRTNHMSNLEFVCESHHQDTAFVEDATPTNISSASTLRPAEIVLSIVESHHIKWGGKANSTINGVSKLEKGKEPISYEADDSRSCSNRRAAGRENFECFSSRGIVSTVKRKRIYEPEKIAAAGGKRLNVDKFSFMNWVASITNGLSRTHYNNESSSEIKCIDHQKEMDALKGIEGEKANSCAKLMVQNSSWVTRLGENPRRKKDQHEGKKDQHQLLHGRRSTVSQKDDKDIETDPVVCEEVISHKNEPKGFFIYVRKLRLSRRDVIRWMKSRASLYNLGGFFLRLRIGKLDKGFGGTSYHVACINGASCQSSISVCVGSSTYSVNTSFISNHDFNENELKAWWFQNVRDGTKMASSEELNDKFQLRLKFGF